VEGYFSSVLHSAARTPGERMLKFLVQSGFRDATTLYGVHGTPLYAAVASRKVRTINYLLSQGELLRLVYIAGAVYPLLPLPEKPRDKGLPLIQSLCPRTPPKILVGRHRESRLI
jgi:hypothetical protein